MYLRTYSEDNKIVVELEGARILEFRPFFAIKGELKYPATFKLHEEPKSTKFTTEIDNIRCEVVVYHSHEETEAPYILLFKVSCSNGISNNGLIAGFSDVNLVAFKRALIYHFTYTPPKYFDNKFDHKFDYPVAVDVDELRYDPWSYPWHTEDLNVLPYNLKVSQILFSIPNGLYLFLLPITNAGCRGYISHFKEGKFDVLLNAYCKTSWSDALILSIGVGKDPYEVVEKVYEITFKYMNKAGCLRKNKHYPKPLEYLGWCSWNAYWRDITEDKILYAQKKFSELKLPIRMFLVDDGWINSKDERIVSFEPNPKRFPHGFNYLVSKLKETVKYVGLWHTLNGYWNGIDPKGELAKRYRDALMEDANGKLVPNPEEKKAFKFYLDWHSFIARCGFDFVKIDNQSYLTYSYRGKVPCEKAARVIEEAIQLSAKITGIDILNCMAEIPEAYFNWYSSNVARACVDYIVPHLRSRDKLHIYFCVYNALWLSQIAYPDYDMFQTHDPLALQQAVARAISGGPVYVTDEPDKTNPEIIRKLSFSDGKLPRPDIPALPTEDVLMRDPYNEHVALKAFTHVSVPGVGTYGIIGVFNITKDDVHISTDISPRDARLNEDKYVVYEYFSERTKVMDLDEVLNVDLEPTATKLFILAPLKDWLVPIGLNNIFVMPKAIERAIIFNDEAIIVLRDIGTLVLYTEEETIEVEGGSIISKEPLKVKCTSHIIRIFRRGK